MKSREAARDDAVQRAMETAFSSIYDVFSGHDEESSAEIIGLVTDKLKKNRSTILRSYEVVSEHTEHNGLCTVKVKAAVYSYKIKELFGSFGQNLE